MRKIILFFVIFSGFITVIFSIMSILSIKEIISTNIWEGKWNSNVTSSTMGAYIVILLIGIAEIIIGRWSWKKARGFSSLILIICFGLMSIIGLYVSIIANSLPISTIVILILSIISFVGLLIGFLKGN